MAVSYNKEIKALYINMTNHNNMPTLEIQMSATKPEVETGSGIKFWMETDGEAISTATSTFSTMPDLGIAVVTLSDIGNPQSELKISSGLQADVLSSQCRPMSDNVGSVISKSGSVENVG